MLVKVTSGSVDTYPYTVGQLRRDNPQVSFPKQIPDAMLADYGVYPVAEADAPSFNKRTQTATRADNPTLVGDVWTIGWVVADKSASEISSYDQDMAADNRGKRNNLLAETDYLALSDNTLTTEMSAYRQALRDISSHANWPNLSDSDWPTKP